MPVGRDRICGLIARHERKNGKGHDKSVFTHTGKLGSVTGSNVIKWSCSHYGWPGKCAGQTSGSAVRQYLKHPVCHTDSWNQRFLRARSRRIRITVDGCGGVLLFYHPWSSKAMAKFMNRYCFYWNVWTMTFQLPNTKSIQYPKRTRECGAYNYTLAIIITFS